MPKLCRKIILKQYRVDFRQKNAIIGFVSTITNIYLLYAMRRFFLFAVLLAGCMLTVTSCLKEEVIDAPFRVENITEKGYEVTDNGVISYVVSNGITYEVELSDVIHQPQEKTDTLSVSFGLLENPAHLYNPTWQGDIETVAVGRGIEKTKTLYRIRAKFDGIDERIPFFFVQETATIEGYSMPYPELNFELKGMTEEELPEIIDGEDHYWVSKLTFACEISYDGKVIPMETSIIGTAKKIPITFDPSVGDWEEGGDVNVGV